MSAIHFITGVVVLGLLAPATVSGQQSEGAVSPASPAATDGGEPGPPSADPSVPPGKPSPSETPHSAAASSSTEAPSSSEAASGEVPPPAAKDDSVPEDKAAPLPERRLQFSFRHTRWIDVLEWLAQQSDLSLVLDAPPPGSFNYSDARAYTPLEAIDLVNGVLASKGYTLVRRERMLTVVSLAGGVPLALLPRVKLEELDDRGKFEMVSIAFPVGKRKIEAVIAEIQVLLGLYGKIAPLPASGQILVTDRAGIMPTIGAVIESIPEAKAPQKSTKSPEKPELGVYALGGNDPAAAVETLKALFDSARFVHDAQSDHINAYATPTQHAAIAQVFEQMKSGVPEGTRPRLEVYPLPDLDPATRQNVLGNLAIVAPDARLRYDEPAERLFVWAKPVQQEAVRNSIVKLLQVAPQQGTRLLQVYTLKRADPATLTTLLQSTLPRARVTVDLPGSRLVVHASPQDQQTVAQLVEQMDAEPAAERRAMLRIYPVDRRLADRVTPLLTQLVPEAKATVDPQLGRVSVVATPGDHLQIESILTRLSEGAAELPQPTVEVVKVPKGLRERFEAIRTLLDGQVPDAKLMWDPESLELTVWATAADHTRVGEFFDQISRHPAAAPDKPTVEIMKVPRKLRDRFEAIRTLLVAEIPKAKLVWDPKTLELTAWATAGEKKRILEILDHLAKLQAIAPDRSTLEVHTLPKSLRDRFESIQTLLTAEVPEAKLVWDPEKLELTVWALPDDHARIREVLVQVAKEPAAAPDRPTLEVHTLPKSLRDRFESIQTLLTAEVPEAKLVWDPESLELAVWALADDHARIREVLAQVAKQPAAPPPKPTVIVHTLPKVLRERYESIQTLLTTQVPKAKLIWDPESLELTVWALPDDHLHVGELLEQISRHPPTEKQRQLAVYPMAMTDLTTVVAMLQNVASEAQITADAIGRRVLVWATPEEQEKIEQAIRAMGASDAAQGARSYMSHPVRGLDLALAIRLLTERLPGITFEQDAPRSALIALASASDHEQIDKILQEMRTAPQTDDSRQVVVYPTDARESEAVAKVLSDLLPGAQVVAERYVPNVSVHGTDEEQRLAKEVVDQWIENSKRPTRMEAERYGLKVALAADLLPQLQRLVPTAYFVQGPSPHVILARAKAEEHELLEKLIEQLDQPITDERVVEVYELPGANITSLRGLLDAETVAQIQVAPAGLDRLIVRATPVLQEKIRAIVDKIGPAMDARPRTVSYPLEHVDPQEAWTVLRALAPQAVIVVQPKSKSLAVSALAEDHRRIADALREIDRPGNKDKQHQALLVPVDRADPNQLLALLQRIYVQERDLAFSYDAKIRSILIVGDPDRHDEIKQIIASADTVETGREPQVEVYRLRNVQPQEAAGVLRGIVPTATIIVQPSTRSLAVSSDSQGQHRVAAALDALERATEHAEKQKVSVIPIVEAEPQALLRLLQTKYVSETDLTFSYDTETQSILVIGPPDRHEEIKEILAAADSVESGGERHVEVYRLRNVQPQEAAGVLQGIVPTATIVVQASTRSLAVSCDSKEQRRVADALDALERATEHTENQKVSIIPIVEAEPQALLQLMQTKYAGETDLTFSYDTGTRSILVVGPAERHEEIKKILAAADSADSGRAQHVAVYPLGRINGYIAQQMVYQLMAKERIPVSLSYEPGGNQLVVVAHDRQHAVIRDTLEQMQPAETDFEVFALKQLDPLIAEDAVIGLFAGALEGGSAPVVDVDQDNSRLYVRATPKQLGMIRDLLIKMGERQLDATDPGSSRKKSRFVPLSGDEQEALDSIRAVWPKLRNNDLRVLDREHPRESLPREPAAPSSPDSKRPAPTAPDNSSGLRSTRPAAGRVGTGLWEGLLGLHPTMGLFCQVATDPSAREQATGGQTTGDQATGDRATADQAMGDRPAEAGERSLKSSDQQAESELSERHGADGAATSPPATSPPATSPPVYIVPGPRGVTIMSEDTGALDQLEQLLSVMSQPQSRGSRRMFVYPLKSSSATRLADTLNKLYRYVPNSSRGRTSRGRTSFVADDRLNALVVFASRSDRQEIEELLEILDVEQTPDMQATHRPVVIPLQHARALIVEQQLRLLYKTQLTAGGKQPAMEIPSGANARTAAVIEQINAIRQGPLMTLGTDEDTNSILVVAPPSLIEEVRKFAEELDRAADEHPRRAVRIVPLKKTNAAEVDRALQRILRTRRRRR